LGLPYNLNIIFTFGCFTKRQAEQLTGLKKSLKDKTEASSVLAGDGGAIGRTIDVVTDVGHNGYLD
jgi:hypothetical protein